MAKPWRLTLRWAAAAGVYLALWVFLISPRVDLLLRIREPRFVLEQVAALLTGLTAAGAAFATVIPGYRRDVAVVPAVFLALWIGAVVAGAVEDAHIPTPALAGDWRCALTILAGGIVPAFIIGVMVRRGVPLAPRTTAALGILAAAALGELGSCLFHADASDAIILTWHCSTVVALTLLAALAGRYVMPSRDWASIHSVLGA